MSGTQQYKDIARHEATHGNVQAVVGEDLSSAVATQYLSESGKKAWQTAAMRKRHYSPKDRMDEVLADLATGNTARLGLERTEALQLMHEILEQMGEQYTPAQMKRVMSRFAPTFKNRPYEAASARAAKTESSAGLKASAEGYEQEPTWYGTAKARLEDIAKQHGVDVKTLAGVAAALSPNNRWAQNVADVKKWAAAQAAGTLKPDSSANTYPKNRNKAFRIMTGEIGRAHV